MPFNFSVSRIEHFPYHMAHHPETSWRHHQMKTCYASLALCEGNSSVNGGFPSQRPVTRNVDVFFYLRLNKRLSKQSRRRWFQAPLRSLWRHCDIEQNDRHFADDTFKCIWCFKDNHNIVWLNPAPERPIGNKAAWVSVRHSVNPSA